MWESLCKTGSLLDFVFLHLSEVSRSGGIAEQYAAWLGTERGLVASGMRSVFTEPHEP